MAFVEERKFKYPAEDECLIRRLGSAVVLSWASLPREVQEKLLTEAKSAWDREFHVPRLPDRMNAILKRQTSQ